MTYEHLFTAANALTLVCWLPLSFAPRSRLTARLTATPLAPPLPPGQCCDRSTRRNRNRGSGGKSMSPRNSQRCIWGRRGRGTGETPALANIGLGDWGEGVGHSLP